MHRSLAAFATVLSVAGALASAGPAQSDVVTGAEVRPGPQGPDKPPAQPTMLRRVLVAAAASPDRPQRVLPAEDPTPIRGPVRPIHPTHWFRQAGGRISHVGFSGTVVLPLA
jgi:hypothetical protein